MHISKIRKICLRFLIVFNALFILTLPFNYNLLKLNILTPFFEKLLKKLVPANFNDTSSYTLDFYSDSTGLYFNIILIIFLSFIAVAFWSYLGKNSNIKINNNRLFSFLFIGICYYLALQMSIYGFNKLFKFQFYDAHPNTLFTPVGFLTKDFLYWTSMGSSSLFNTITGLTEVFISIFLLFKPTRFLASILGFFGMLYVFFINIAFDINVKIQSLFLVFLFSILLFPYIKTYYQFFIKKKTVRIRPIPVLIKTGTRYAMLKIIVVSLIFTEALYPYVKSNSFNGDTVVKPPFYGAYSIKNDSVYKRFFIHSDPYFIIQDKDDNLYSFPMTLDSKYFIVKFNDRQTYLSYSSQDSIFSVKGDFFGYPLNIKATKIDIDTLPFFKDSFKWTIDSYGKE